MGEPYGQGDCVGHCASGRSGFGMVSRVSVSV